MNGTTLQKGIKFDSTCILLILHCVFRCKSTAHLLRDCPQKGTDPGPALQQKNEELKKELSALKAQLAVRDCAQAKNGLKTYCFQMKSTMEKMNDKVSGEDKNTILDKVKETLTWLDNNQSTQKEGYEHKLKELEGVCNPITDKLQPASG